MSNTSGINSSNNSSFSEPAYAKPSPMTAPSLPYWPDSAICSNKMALAGSFSSTTPDEKAPKAIQAPYLAYPSANSI